MDQGQGACRGLSRGPIRDVAHAGPVAGPDVRNGSNSEVELADADFRFTPESRHPAGGLGCPFSAINRNPLRLSYRRYNMSLCLDIWMPAAQLKLLQP
jgi:hypothetical protein